MDIIYKGKSWSELTKFIKETWKNYDLSNTIFDNTFFKETTFDSCLFLKSDVTNMGVFSCGFVNCNFESVKFKSIAIGAKGGLYKGCNFKKCDFKGQQFNYPRFEDCVFDNCKLKNIDCNDASFFNCSFIGKMEDVSFNGMYHTNKTSFKPLEKVDFSNALFGEFVNFYDCDLSTSIPPSGTTFADLLYQIYSNDPTVLSTGSKDRIVLTKSR